MVSWKHCHPWRSRKLILIVANTTSSEGLQSSYTRRPHGTTTRKQRTVATATPPDLSLRAFCQRRCAQACGQQRSSLQRHLVRSANRHSLGRPPQSLGYGGGMTCWRRLRDWNAAGVWEQLHQAMLSRLREHVQIDWSRPSIDGSSVPSPRGARKQALTQRTEASSAPSGTSS